MAIPRLVLVVAVALVVLLLAAPSSMRLTSLPLLKQHPHGAAEFAVLAAHPLLDLLLDLAAGGPIAHPLVDLAAHPLLELLLDLAAGGPLARPLVDLAAGGPIAHPLVELELFLCHCLFHDLCLFCASHFDLVRMSVGVSVV